MRIVQVSLENEMDLTLAYKKSIKAAELIGLSMSTQTAFATAVSEVCREVIDKANDGTVSIEILNQNTRFLLGASVSYKVNENVIIYEEALQYAKRLVPVFEHKASQFTGSIVLQITIPLSTGLNKKKVTGIAGYFANLEPTTPYEEIKQKKQELSLMNEQSELALQHLEYLNQQKNEFLTVASHELKTPLTILRAYTQMATKSDCNEVTLAHLKKVDAQALKLQTMITQLLDISKIDAQDVEYNVEEVEVGSYMKDMNDLVRQIVPGHELMVDVDTNARVKIDKLRVEQVIMNIVGNAAKYSPTGKQIFLSVTNGPDQDIIFSVKDQGIGMSKDEQNKIFNKFYRVEGVVKQYNGLGMGLYISSKIISNLGGKIWVESREKEGSTFYFTLPVLSASN